MNLFWKCARLDRWLADRPDVARYGVVENELRRTASPRAPAEPKRASALGDFTAMNVGGQRAHWDADEAASEMPPQPHFPRTCARWFLGSLPIGNTKPKLCRFDTIRKQEAESSMPTDDLNGEWSPNEIWRRFVASVDDYNVEGPLDDTRAPLTAYPVERATLLLFVTKDALVRYWLHEELLPPTTAVFDLHGPATAQHCALVKRQADGLKVPHLFYGDLDPMDLTTFGTLRAGGTRWDHDPATAISLDYRGINDRVLALAEKNVNPSLRASQAWDTAAEESSTDPPDSKLRPLIFPMIPDERRHFEVLEKLMPDLEELVGPRCLELLRQGWKIEVEALHPTHFGKGFVSKLLKMILEHA